MDKIKIGHSIKNICEALKKRNSIFSVAINRGLVNPASDDIALYLCEDSKMIKMIDDFHTNLLTEAEKEDK